jgi:hypothetical protein
VHSALFKRGYEHQSQLHVDVPVVGTTVVVDSGADVVVLFGAACFVVVCVVVSTGFTTACAELELTDIVGAMVTTMVDTSVRTVVVTMAATGAESCPLTERS